MSEVLFELLQISIGIRKELTKPLQSNQWKILFHMLKKQALFGVGFEAICKLPMEQRPPKPLLLQGFAQAEFIKEQNNLLNKRVLELRDILQDMEIPYCILKGQGVGLLYLTPEYRQPGDIDVWCDAEYRKILLEKVALKYKVKDTLVHHTHVDFFDDVKVDLHYIPTWLYAPWYYKRLMHFLSIEKKIQMNNKNKVGFNVPTIKFNLVYSMMHLFWHFMGGGIGLRQFMDYYYIVMHSTETDRDEAVKIIRGIGKTRFLGAVMYVLQSMFLLDKEYCLVEPNTKLGKTLLDEILIGGNFGYYDERRRKKGTGTKWGNIKRRFIRLFGFFAFAPSEVLCSPFWKTWHYCWRRKNGYL